MSTTTPCPRCRQALPTDAPEGLCPRCLLAGETEPATAADAEPSAAELSQRGDYEDILLKAEAWTAEAKEWAAEAQRGLQETRRKHAEWMRDMAEKWGVTFEQ